MNPFDEHKLAMTRRHFFQAGALGLGTAALTTLLPGAAPANPQADLPHFAPKAKRAIYLLMNEGPSQMDMWDHKPKMADMFDKDLPKSVIGTQRLTTMTSRQTRFP